MSGIGLTSLGDVTNLFWKLANSNDEPNPPTGIWHTFDSVTDTEMITQYIQSAASTARYLGCIARGTEKEIIWINESRPLPE